MACMSIQTRPAPSFLFFFFWTLLCSSPVFVSSQSNQNIETFFPFSPPPPSLPLIPPPPPLSPPPPVHSLPPPLLSLPPPAGSSSGKTIGKAVAITAASAVVVFALFFFVLRRRAMSRRRNAEDGPAANESLPAVFLDEADGFDGNIKGLIVDENGLDVVYWRRLQGIKNPSLGPENGFKRMEIAVRNPRRNGNGDSPETEEEPVRRFQKVPLLRGKSSSSELNPEPDRPAMPPPPPLKHVGMASSTKPSPQPLPKLAGSKAEGSSSGGGQGSGQANDDLMEALFGYVAKNRRFPINNKKTTSPGNVQSGQIFILDARKSQDVVTILKSLSVSRNDILYALTEGRGLDLDTLEKLNRVAPTREEELQIIAFDGVPTRLADAESFLFHILKAIPSAFTRFSAMLFKLNYESEIRHVRESIQTLELGCKELRTRGLFMKLLEAILKAGNRMNAGTYQGNAQGFNLGALKKLSEVKSTDGKTTLLHFVVEEVVRSEGRRCAINRARSLARSGSLSNVHIHPENPSMKEDQEKDYLMLGLPVVGGLSAEFPNVKKAASIDYASFSGSYAALKSRVSDIRDLISQCNADEGGFAKEMKGFLGSAEAQIASLRNDQVKAIELVKSTMDYYYQAGSNPIKLFGIIRDFLGMVDEACIEIARNAQKKKPTMTAEASSTPEPTRKTMRFPKLPANFLSDSKSIDSDNDS